MSNRYATYGFVSGSLEEVCRLIEHTLGIALVERDSSYYGGTYYKYTAEPGRELKIYLNHDSVMDRLIHERYRDYRIILEISALDDMEGIERKVTHLPGDPVLLESCVLQLRSDSEPEESP